MTDIDKLTGRELDCVLLSEVFKFPIKKIFYTDWDEHHEFPYYIPSGKPKRTHMIDSLPVPNFSTSLNACHKAEMEIERRGLRVDYMVNLIELIDLDPESAQPHFEWYWRIRTVDPETLCRAMIKTIREAAR